MVETQKKRQENIALHNVDISASTVKMVETYVPYNGVIRLTLSFQFFNLFKLFNLL